MKEQILALLKTKFNGVSDAILNRIATKLAKTVTTEEDAQTAVDGVTFQQMLESYGDARAKEATDTATRTYEKKYKLKDGKPIEDPQPEPAPKGGEDVPEWAKALVESNKALTERLNKMETERTTKSRKQQLSAIIDKLPESLRKGYGRIALDSLSKEDFDNMLTEVTAEVESIVKDTQQKSMVFGKPLSKEGNQQNTGKTATNEEAAAVVAKLGI